MIELAIFAMFGVGCLYLLWWDMQSCNDDDGTREPTDKEDIE